MSSLKNITIGSGSFVSGQHFELTNMNSLEELKFGEGIFNGNNGGDNIEDNKFSIRNAPSLKNLDIGDGSFTNIKSLILEGLDSLKNLNIGEIEKSSIVSLNVDSNSPFRLVKNLTLSSNE